MKGKPTMTPYHESDGVTLLPDGVSRCFECDAPADHQHHVIPRSKGGKRTVWLCSPCHAKVHSKHLLSTSRLTQQALNEKRKNGERIGQVPYGYVLGDDGKRLVADEKQQVILQWMRRQRQRGVALRRICEALEIAGIPTALNKGGWQDATVKRLTDRYKGPKPKYGKPTIEPLPRSVYHSSAVSVEN